MLSWRGALTSGDGVVGMTGEQRMRTVAEHLAQALALVAPLPSVDLPLAEALGRRLTRDVVSGSDLPRWDNSAMDGYAVRASDTVDAGAQGVRLEVVADLPAGTAQEPRRAARGRRPAS